MFAVTRRRGAQTERGPKFITYQSQGPIQHCRACACCAIERANNAIDRVQPTAPDRTWWLESRFFDRQSQPILADQFVVREPALQVLGDHVDILKMALDQVALERGGRTG